MLKRKLRPPLWPDTKECICFCGRKMDQFGDHVLSCRNHCKTPLSNKIRDGLFEILKPICKTVKLISQENMVDKERPRVVTKLPRIRPFDLSILLDHMLDEHAWRCSLKMIGFDVTVIPSTPTRSTATEAARKKRIKIALADRREGQIFAAREKHAKTLV